MLAKNKKIGDIISENGTYTAIGYETPKGNNSYSFSVNQSPPSNSITLGFNAINNHSNSIVISTSKVGEPNTLDFRENGDIYVHGKLIENDKQIVDGFRTFLNEYSNFK